MKNMNFPISGKSLPNLGTLGVYFMFTLSFAYSVYDGWSNLVRKQQLWSGRKLSDLLVVKKEKKTPHDDKSFFYSKMQVSELLPSYNFGFDFQKVFFLRSPSTSHFGTLYEVWIELTTLGPDRLCLLWEIAACYFLLVIYSL